MRDSSFEEIALFSPRCIAGSLIENRVSKRIRKFCSSSEAFILKLPDASKRKRISNSDVDRENPSRVTPGCHFYFQHLLFTLCAPIARVSSPFALRRTREFPRAARNKIEGEHYLARGLFSAFWILQSFARKGRREGGSSRSSRNART